MQIHPLPMLASMALALGFVIPAAAPASAALLDERAAAAKPLRVSFGTVGKARAGMTVARAMKTGQFNRNVRGGVPGICSYVIPLQPKRPWQWAYVPWVKGGRIKEMAVTHRRFRTRDDLGVGTRARKVLRTLDHVKPGTREVGYGQWAIDAHNGKAGNQRRWITFVFDVYTYDRELQVNDRVYYMVVSAGRRPVAPGMDGC